MSYLGRPNIKQNAINLRDKSKPMIRLLYRSLLKYTKSFDSRPALKAFWIRPTELQDKQLSRGFFYVPSKTSFTDELRQRFRKPIEETTYDLNKRFDSGFFALRSLASTHQKFYQQILGDINEGDLQEQISTQEKLDTKKIENFDGILETIKDVEGDASKRIEAIFQEIEQTTKATANEKTKKIDETIYALIKIIRERKEELFKGVKLSTEIEEKFKEVAKIQKNEKITTSEKIKQLEEKSKEIREKLDEFERINKVEFEETEKTKGKRQKKQEIVTEKVEEIIPRKVQEIVPEKVKISSSMTIPKDSKNWAIPAPDSPIVPGMFLVAHPQMRFEFGHTVILVCTHDETGTTGLCLNRKIKRQEFKYFSKRAKKSFKLLRKKMFGLSSNGGPVERSAMSILHTLKNLPNAIPLSNGISLGGERKILEQDLLKTSTEARIFFGYSSWKVGQLEKELEAGAWFKCHASENFVFNELKKKTKYSIWKSLLQSMEGEYASFVDVPDKFWSTRARLMEEEEEVEDLSGFEEAQD